MSLKNSNETIGNRTRDLPVCSVVLAAKVLLPNDNVRHINGSQNTTVFIIIYYLRATCFDSLESSSGPLMNRPKTI